jgi:hypothetical protein
MFGVLFASTMDLNPKHSHTEATGPVATASAHYGLPNQCSHGTTSTVGWHTYYQGHDSTGKYHIVRHTPTAWNAYAVLVGQKSHLFSARCH